MHQPGTEGMGGRVGPNLLQLSFFVLPVCEQHFLHGENSPHYIPFSFHFLSIPIEETALAISPFCRDASGPFSFCM